VLDRPRAEEAFSALLAYPLLVRVWLIGQGSEVVGHVVVAFVFAMAYGGRMAVVDDFSIRRLSAAPASAPPLSPRCAGLARSVGCTP
jgi:hypothetical protein